MACSHASAQILWQFPGRPHTDTETMRILSSGIFIDQRDPRSRRDHLPSAYRRLYLLERHAPEPAHGYARAHMCDEQRGLAAGALAWATSTYTINATGGPRTPPGVAACETLRMLL